MDWPTGTRDTEARLSELQFLATVAVFRLLGMDVRAEARTHQTVGTRWKDFCEGAKRFPFAPVHIVMVGESLRMRHGFFRFFFLALAAFIFLVNLAGAQQLPPAEPPQAMPGSHADSPTLRVTTNEVLVPTLVEKPHGGGIMYGLKQSDFVVEDNGVPQKIRVQEEMDTAPVSLGDCA